MLCPFERQRNTRSFNLFAELVDGSVPAVETLICPYAAATLCKVKECRIPFPTVKLKSQLNVSLRSPHSV